jgi:methylated-DNA-[protein]-cysteine S-methyltransferase
VSLASETFFVYPTPLGRITLACDGAGLTRVVFGVQELPGTYAPCEITNRASTQIQEYLAGKRKTFDLPLHPLGTQFQRNVWDKLQTIPYGQTRSYKEVAQMLGNPKAMRAVGMANNKNPLPIVIPCHRVIGANGDLVGYAFGLKIKKFLLDLEKNTLAKEQAKKV